MTSVQINCVHQGEKGMNFEIRISQGEQVHDEEKMACIFLLPFVKEALEKALRVAEGKEEAPKIQTNLDGGPSIVTLE